MAELVDAPDLGSGATRRGGSSPSTRTTFYVIKSVSKPLQGAPSAVLSAENFYRVEGILLKCDVKLWITGCAYLYAHLPCNT